MVVWFHSTMEQDRTLNKSFYYDSMTDSKLFASLSLCERDAIDCYQEDLVDSEKRYNDSLRRYETAKKAMDILAANDLDVSELYWMNYAVNAPEFHKPQGRYIYAIDVTE